ncbi:MAG: archaeosine biosynthesis radical SAM protein RaSEA [bacterium]|nr:archaeosine biosynthesis radical SAM protein RaSEA [bacterium]
MKPAFSRISPVNVDGEPTKRLMVVLKTRGCEYARKTNGGCTVCGFLNHAKEDITDEEILAQLDYCLENEDITGVKELDLLTLGSFLNDNEVCAATRRKLLGKIAPLEGIKHVSFESRAEYVTVEKLKEGREILKGKTVEFGIGLESSDDYIRNKIVKKGLSKMAFEEVVLKVKEAGCNLLTYLLVKPPHLTEKAAIEDAVNSANFVFDTAGKYGVTARAAFEPVFICQNTKLEELFLQRSYRLVNLWSIVEIIKQIHHRGNIFLGLSDENLSFERLPNSCEKCNLKIIAAVEMFNNTQDASVLDHLECECKADYEYKLERGLI